MRRGEVWWADLPPPAGRRPVVLVTRDSAYRVRTSVTIAPVTRTVRNIPVEVPLDQRDGLPARCVVNVDDLTTIEKSFLKQRMASLSAEKMQQVEEAIRFALDLP
jgi:mRNA interferase MazF